MSTQALKAATQAQKEPRTFNELVIAMKPEIARALPRHMDADRMCRIATTEFRKNPKLGDCEIRSVFGAIITLSQLGLEPGVNGQAYLIPYKETCTAVPGWQGLVDLVSRAGRASVWTGAVYEGDEFDYSYGDRPHITHRPNEDDEVAGLDKLTHVYAVGRIKNAEWPVIEVWSKAKVTKHRDRYNKVGNRHYSFQHFEMYARKVALLQVLKYMPKSIELQNAVAVENASQHGVTIDVQQAVSGWVPEAPADDQTTGGDQGNDNATKVDADSAIAAIRATETIAALDEAFKRIAKNYSDANESIPVAIEAARNDRRAAIEQKL